MNKKWILLFTGVFVITLLFVLIQSLKTEAKEYQDIGLRDYEQYLDEQKEFTIYIYSTKCSTCESFAPTLNSVINETKSKVVALDVSKQKNNDKEFFKEKKIELTPTLIKYRDGKETDRKVGNIPEKELKDFLLKD